MSLVEALKRDTTIVAAELRPPRAELGAREGMDAWIDMYHAVRNLARRNVRVFLTDSAVGTQEENNLRHLVTNLGRDVAHDHVVPFLTAKHSIEFCLTYAEQAWQHGFPSLVVLGGDKTIGRPRCVQHAWQLREQIREREPRLSLGGWANPYGDPVQQVEYLMDDRFTGEYFLTQIVSHLDIAPVERFIARTQRTGITKPGIYGVFFYRSANPKTLAALSNFLPVPAERLIQEFESEPHPSRSVRER
jgi:5,10-methylenetetrahydrofolate reductase